MSGWQEREHERQLAFDDGMRVAYEIDIHQEKQRAECAAHLRSVGWKEDGRAFVDPQGGARRFVVSLSGWELQELVEYRGRDRWLLMYDWGGQGSPAMSSGLASLVRVLRHVHKRSIPRDWNRTWTKADEGDRRFQMQYEGGN